jgi:hypothetical protein
VNTQQQNLDFADFVCVCSTNTWVKDGYLFLHQCIGALLGVGDILAAHCLIGWRERKFVYSKILAEFKRKRISITSVRNQFSEFATFPTPH